MDILRKSFKSSGELQHKSEEERQILLHQQQESMGESCRINNNNNKEEDVIVNISNSPETELTTTTTAANADGINNIWRDSSYDFSNDVASSSNDLDFDSPASSQPTPLSRILESPSMEGKTTRRRTSGVANPSDEVLTCSSNASFRRKSSLLRMKTKSRLMDPPIDQDGRSQRRSGFIGKASEFDEDDPFLEDDLPEEYKSIKFNIFMRKI